MQTTMPWATAGAPAASIARRGMAGPPLRLLPLALRRWTANPGTTDAELDRACRKETV